MNRRVTVRIGITPTGPLDIDEQSLAEKHWAVRGATGQRKTMFLLSILCQYIKLPDHAVIFIDLGGDTAAHWILHEAARAANKTFYLFALDDSIDCCSWDPILDTPVFREKPLRAASGVTTGLNLTYGSGGFGRSFFARLNQSTINQAFDNLRVSGVSQTSFKALAEELKRMAQRSRSSRNPSEALYAAEHLMRYPTLTSDPGSRDRINIGRAIEEGAVIVFYVPTAFDEEAARAVASMASWCTMVEAAYRTEVGGNEDRTVHLAIDEFSQIASGKSSVESALVMSRKWGLRMYFCYQNDEQLNTSDGDLVPIIRDNCQRVLFTCSSEAEIDDVRFQSKDTIRTLGGKSTHRMSSSKQEREIREPEITRNEVLDVSAVSMMAYAVLRLGDKHRDPIPFTIIPPTASPAAHAKLKSKPLPKRPLYQPQVTPTVASRSKRARNDPARKEWLKTLSNVIQQREAEMDWRK